MLVCGGLKVGEHRSDGDGGKVGFQLPNALGRRWNWLILAVVIALGLGYVLSSQCYLQAGIAAALTRSHFHPHQPQRPRT